MDFGAVYAPVFDFTVTLLTTLVCLCNNWKVQHVRLKAAFLNGDIARDCFVYHPYNLSFVSQWGNVYKRHKALYGLRQVPLQWFKKLTDYLVQRAKYQQLRSDRAVLIKRIDGAPVIILACVDYLLFFGNTSAVLNTAIADFLTYFDESAEPLEWYLGVHYKLRSDSVQLS